MTTTFASRTFPPSAAAQRAGFRAPRLAACKPVSSRPRVLQNSFLQPVATTSSLCSAFSGLTLTTGVASPTAGRRQRGALVITANAKRSAGCTFGGTNRKKKRVSGFLARMKTPGGRRVLKRRRTKGRKYLCPASMRKGKYVQKPKKFTG